MMSVPRTALVQFRTVLRQALAGVPRATWPWVRLCSTPERMVLESVMEWTAVRYEIPGSFEAGDLAVPFEALCQLRGKGHDPVEFSAGSRRTISMRWMEAGAVREQVLPQRDPSSSIPAMPVGPARLTPQPPEFRDALQETTATTDTVSSRYALGCLQLDGREGKILATDGRQALIQGGFSFPWKEAILVPGTRLFEAAALSRSGPISVGRRVKWVTFVSGPWTIHLGLNTGRFPSIAAFISPTAPARTVLEIAPADAAWLIRNPAALPGSIEEGCRTVSIDLDQAVVLRGMRGDQATELALSNSHHTGEPLCVACDRTYLIRAIELGFRSVRLKSGVAPIISAAPGRCYAWMALGEGRRASAGDDVERIATPAVPRIEVTNHAAWISTGGRIESKTAAGRPHHHG